MSRSCRILKSGQCETTQGFSDAHLANDIVGPGYTLDTIVAHSDGKVVFHQDGLNNDTNSTGNASYGNCIKLDHGKGYETLYAHMQKGLYVSNGQYVAKGQELGYMGNSGRAFGGHLHFEVRKDGVRIDPTEFVDKDLFTIIELPNPVEINDKVNQVEIAWDDTMRVRTDHSTNSEIIGIAKKGYYNIVSTYEDGEFTWYEVEKGKWIAGASDCVVYHPLKEEPIPEPTPTPEPKPEPTPKEPEITENFIKRFFKALIDLIKKWLNL